MDEGLEKNIIREIIRKILTRSTSTLAFDVYRACLNRKFISQELRVKKLERHMRSDSESYMR